MTDNQRKVLQIYQKEREYQKCCFGEYKHIHSLNFASFLEFIEEYIRKAKAAYCGPWQKQLTPWLESCKEMEEGGSAPIDAYAEIIKVMALAGAALETYSELNPYEWRPEPESEGQKWK